MNEEQKDISEEEIVKKFQKELLDNTKPLDPEIQKLVNDNFWDLVDNQIMKSYTDIEQSKKLAEILPIESADMWWSKNFIYYNPTAAIGISVEYSNVYTYKFGEDDIPCWSLAALFKLLPKCVEGAEPSLIKTFRDDYRIVYDIHDDENITSEDYTNPIDACVEMILKLKEEDLI